MKISQDSTQTMTGDEIQDWLANQIAEQLGIDALEIDIRTPFESYGLNSMQAMAIASVVKQRFGLHLSPLLIWNYPNIFSLSNYLATELETTQFEIFEI